MTNKCKICQSSCKKIFSAKMLGKYNADYLFCEHCGFLFVENPTWLKEAYTQSINIEDTGILQRNIDASNRLKTLLYVFFDHREKYLDFAGGWGLLVRLMRDIGFDYYWNDAHSQNLFARGFEGGLKTKYSAITSIECFEHFADPIKEIEEMLNVASTIIFTTELLPQSPLPPERWSYYGLSHGQHVSFFSKKTLHYIAARYGLNYFNILGFHIFSKKRLMLDLVGKTVTFNLLWKLLTMNKKLKSRISLDMNSVIAMNKR